jgi:hypothetical protein
MNSTYEIEYHADRFAWNDSEILTVDGRSARQNRTPECLIEYARDKAKIHGYWRFRISRIKVAHLTATQFHGMVAHLIYEEDLSEQMVVVS